MSVATLPGLMGKHTGDIDKLEANDSIKIGGLTQISILEVKLACKVVQCRLRRTVGKRAYRKCRSISDTARTRRDRDEFGRRCASCEKRICRLE
jgi:hypothetical protein